MPCRVCGTVVPLGLFCGLAARICPRSAETGRIGYASEPIGAAPGEHLLRVSVISSLFPHLPHRSRATFRVGLAALVIVLIVLALLRWQAPLIGLSALGFLLLFQLYLQEYDVYRDLPVRALVAGGGDRAPG